MANGLLTGYFGQPENFQPNYGLSGAGLQMAQMPEGRGGVAASYDIGQQNLGLFQNAMGQLLNSQGVYSPTQERERALQGILGGTNPQDPNSLAEASRKLMGLGMTAEAAQLMKQAQEVAKNTAEVGKLGAEANKAMAWEGVEGRKMQTKAMTDIEVANIKGRFDQAIQSRTDALRFANNSLEAQKLQAEIAKLQSEKAKVDTLVATGGKQTEAQWKENTYQQLIAEGKHEDATDFATRHGLQKTYTKEIQKELSPVVEANRMYSDIDSELQAAFDAMKLAPEQRARIISDPSEFFKNWTGGQDISTTALMAKQRVANSQLIANLSQLKGSTAVEEMKQMAKGILDPKANNETVVREFVNLERKIQDNFGKTKKIMDYGSTAKSPVEVQKYMTEVYSAKPSTQKSSSEGLKPIGKTPDGKTVYMTPEGKKVVME